MPKPRPWLLLLSSVLLAFLVLTSTSPLVYAKERPRIGLVLGGGGARGIAHVGVLKVLEEMRVPVDCVAGTSMGSIIGGLYAAGMTPQQMEEALGGMNWPEVFRDGPPRADLPFRTKQEQRVLLNAKVGLDRDGVQLPQGLLEGQNLLLVLEKLSLPAAGIHDFDKLRLPYRAVATDLASGTPVVISSGELAMAMRASMSIPSILVPVQLDGKLLVDGGVADNLPIDVTRKLCKPDVIIAVDVGAPLSPASELNSFLAVTNQLTTILTVRNVAEQVKTLGKRDILLNPNLHDISSVNFSRSLEAIKFGEVAAREQQATLQKVALSPAEYAAYLAALPAAPNADDEHPIIDFIKIKNGTRLADSVIERQLHIQPGDRLNPAKLNRNLNEIYGMGDFQRVNYTLVEEDGKTGLIVEAVPSDIGTNTLQLGLFLGANLRGDSSFNISAGYNMTQLNTLGGEWRNFLQLGGHNIFQSDFYQPLDDAQLYFIDPYFRYERQSLNLANQGFGEDGSYWINRTKLGLDMGRNFERWGRLTLGVNHSSGKNQLRFGPPSGHDGNFNDSSYYLNFRIDTLDNVSFPTSGSFSNITFRNALTALGADDDFSTLSVEWAHAYTWEQYSIIPRIELSGRVSGELGLENRFLLGGFLNLSGYQNNELAGEYSALGQLIYMYRLDDASAAFTIPIFAGGSLELGGVWNDYRDIDRASLIPAGSLFIGVDTPLGPLYGGAGWAEGGNTSLYMVLGRLF